MKKTIIVIILFFIFILCITAYFLFNNNNEIETSYMIREDETSAYFGKLNYCHKTKKAWISGGYGTILFKEVKKILKNGIKENVAEQKKYVNRHLNSINKPWREKNPSFVPYEITPDDYEIKIIKPDDPEFFNSLRYYFIKKYQLCETDKIYITRNYKTPFHVFYYIFHKPPYPAICSRYYSTVYPHHEISEKERIITLEFYD